MKLIIAIPDKVVQHESGSNAGVFAKNIYIAILNLKPVVPYTVMALADTLNDSI